MKGRANQPCENIIPRELRKLAQPQTAKEHRAEETERDRTVAAICVCLPRTMTSLDRCLVMNALAQLNPLELRLLASQYNRLVPAGRLCCGESPPEMPSSAQQGRTSVCQS